MKRSSLQFVFFGMLCLFGVSLAGAGERAGNFEITITPVNKESSQTTGGDSGNWQEKEKSQMLTYKVKITYKGLEKLENVQIKYLVVYTAPGNSNNDHGGSSWSRTSTQITKGEEKVEKFATLDSTEFITKGIENVYHENTWRGGKNSWGKAQLKGIAIKIMQDDKVLADYGKPNDMKDYWKRDESSGEQKSN